MQSPLYFSSMRKVDKASLAYKKPFAGLSREEYSELLDFRGYMDHYQRCFITLRQRTCGPYFKNGTKIRKWKRRERVFKHEIESHYKGAHVPIHLRDIDLNENLWQGPVRPKRKKKQK